MRFRRWPRPTPFEDTSRKRAALLSFGPRMRCTKCGHLGADVRADWSQLRGVPRR
jgi:hypothetical protein